MERKPGQSRCARGTGGAAAGGRDVFPMDHYQLLTAPSPEPDYIIEIDVPPSRRPTVVRIERYDPEHAAALEAIYPGRVYRSYDGDPYVVLLSPAEEDAPSPSLSRRPRADA